MLTYGPNGVSRGIATIIFSKPGSANDALTQLNGMLVDKRPMKVKETKVAIIDYFADVAEDRSRPQCIQSCYSSRTGLR